MACASTMILSVSGGRPKGPSTDIDIDALERLLPSTLRQRLVFEIRRDPYAGDAPPVFLDGRPITGRSLGEVIDAIYVHHEATRRN